MTLIIMPGIYKKNDYDLAGFVVGVVDKKHMITGQTIKNEDVLIGIASSGLHSNGYSLARKILFDMAGWNLSTSCEGLSRSLGEELLAPTRIYASLVKQIKNTVSLKGIAHITGGAFYDKIIRIVPKTLGVTIRNGSWPVPKLFEIIAEQGDISPEEMHRAFNMGIGLVLIVDEKDQENILDQLKKANEPAWVIGAISVCAGQVKFV